MTGLRAWCSRFGGLFDKERKDRELAEELDAHVQMHVEDNLRAGMSPQEARRQALIQLGGIEQAKEKYRERRGIVWLESVLQDVRFGARMLWRKPGFTAIAVLTLALAIGANTAIFSLIDALMLRLLPVRDPAGLVQLISKYPDGPGADSFSWQSYEHFRDNNHVFSDLIATGESPFSGQNSFYVRGDGLEPEQLDGQYVTGNFFPVLGISAAVGRLIGPQDSQVDSPAPVAVVSWSYWSRRSFDRAIVGERIIVQDVPVTIIGVTPRQFFGVNVDGNRDIWLPIAIEPMMHSAPRYAETNFPWVNIMGRLRPGASIEQARAEMSVLIQWTIDQQLNVRKDPHLRELTRGLTSDVQPAGAGLTQPYETSLRKPLLLLMALVSALLLIACINVANMLLARGTAREREMSIRIALGAGHLRLLRQLLTESLLLSTIGMLVGIPLAYLCTGALIRVIESGRFQIVIRVAPDSRVMLFTICAMLVTGVAFGLAPYWQAFASFPTSAGHGMGRMGGASFGRSFGKGLVVAQVSLSLVLLSIASLLVRHLTDLEHIDLGFQSDHVLLVTLDPTHSDYEKNKVWPAYQQLLDHLRAIPGVRTAAVCSISPVQGPGANRDATVEGDQAKPGEPRFVMENWVGPNYFEAVGTPFLMGRDFDAQDLDRDLDRSRVAIINQTMVRDFFGDRNPIGRHVTFEGDARTYEIVGVVADAHYQEIREPVPRTIYFDTIQADSGRTGRDRPASQFVIRTRTDPESLIPEVRRTVRDTLKTVPVVRFTTLIDQVNASILPERFVAMLSGLFGTLGLVLAGVGLYGLLAYAVARRTNEIGIRMALGASRRDVIFMVLGDVLVMVCAGLAIGVPIAFGSQRYIASLMQDLPAERLVPVIFAAVTMIAVALLASYVPARRATRVDPMVALRHE